MKLSEKTNFQILREFETACFRITNYPSNKSISKEFARLEKEIASRLKLTEEEINILINENM